MPQSQSESFAATRWTLVIQASGGDADAGVALSELCAAYYAPVVAFLRSEDRDDDTARELAHGFFAGLLAGSSLGGADPARGRFRTYLLGAVKHFLRDARERAKAGKRGGGVVPVRLEDTASGFGVPVQDAADSEQTFDRQWALTVIGRALDSVASEFRETGKSAQFETLKPWLTGECIDSSQSEAAAALGMSEGAVKVAIHRLRQRFRELIKTEIAHTVPADDDVEDELRYLIAVLAA
jgi:DNA-directed RNA polymerase specialized sigma24 family protein